MNSSKSCSLRSVSSDAVSAESKAVAEDEADRDAKNFACFDGDSPVFSLFLLARDRCFRLELSQRWHAKSGWHVKSGWEGEADVTTLGNEMWGKI